VSKSGHKQPATFLKAMVACTPWVLSMYTLYLLEYGKIWSLETPHRGKISVIILLTGMGLSFVIYSRLFRAKPGRNP
jgi:hypothetical protein